MKNITMAKNYMIHDMMRQIYAFDVGLPSTASWERITTVEADIALYRMQVDSGLSTYATWDDIARTRSEIVRKSKK